MTFYNSILKLLLTFIIPPIKKLHYIPRWVGTSLPLSKTFSIEASSRNFELRGLHYWTAQSWILAPKNVYGFLITERKECPFFE